MHDQEVDAHVHWRRGCRRSDWLWRCRSPPPPPSGDGWGQCSSHSLPSLSPSSADTDVLQEGWCSQAPQCSLCFISLAFAGSIPLSGAMPINSASAPPSAAFFHSCPSVVLPDMLWRLSHPGSKVPLQTEQHTQLLVGQGCLCNHSSASLNSFSQGRASLLDPGQGAVPGKGGRGFGLMCS